MALSAGTALWLNQRTTVPAISALIILFACGGLAAFMPAITIANVFRLTDRKSRFAAFFVALTICTVGLTALFYALHFRFYFSQWHADPFTIRWAFEFAFTIAAALYQFAVLGLRLFFPVGLVALFLAACWYAIRSH
ncbi:MAG: hypothetical protein AB3N20_20435 [Rhizobiaceae bacterium]